VAALGLAALLPANGHADLYAHRADGREVAVDRSGGFG